MVNKIQREQEFHNQRFSDDSDRARRVRNFYSLTRTVNQKYASLLRVFGQDSRVLEFGCGVNAHTTVLRGVSSSIAAFDISEVALSRVQQKMKNENKIFLTQMDGHHLGFGDNTFDLVCGTGILHHLDLTDALQQITRVLKPTGHAIFVEPLGHNPFINLFRRLTPSIRSRDEHPLLQQDLSRFSNHFRSVATEYFYLSTLAATPFVGTRFQTPLANNLERLDKALFRLAFFRRQAWQVLVKLSNPLNP